MDNLYEKINEFHAKMAELKTPILEAIKEYVIKNGKLLENGDHSFSIDNNVSEVIDPVRILVETDRHTGDMGYESIDTIIVNDKGEVFIETSSYCAAAQIEVNFEDLVETYEYLFYFEENGLDECLNIKDGRLQLKEE